MLSVLKFMLWFILAIQVGCQSLRPKGDSMATKRPLIHGHRGSRGTHPENTLPAFNEAVNAGANVLEMDLQLTSDDVLVLSHDPELTSEHCLDSKGKALKKPVVIRKIKAAEFLTYDCGSLGNSHFLEQAKIPKTHPMTLEALLIWAEKAAPNLLLNIEIKRVPPPSAPQVMPPMELFVDKFIEAIHKHKRTESTILQSFDMDVIRYAKTKSTLKLSCLFEQGNNFCDVTRSLGATIASPLNTLLNDKVVAHCRKYGIALHPWTANTEAEWAELTRLGVDGIITDYPRKLNQYLNHTMK